MGGGWTLTTAELDVSMPTPQSVIAARIAVVLWLVTIGFTLLGLALIATTNGAAVPGSYGFPGFTALFAFTFATVGTIVVMRRPGNVVGRVLLLAGLVAGFQTFYTEYAIVGIIVAPGSLPFPELGAWLTAWAWLPFVYLAGPLLLSIFPDGRFLSRRWALAPLVAAVAAIGFIVLAAFRIGPLENFSVTDNPFGFLSSDVANPLIVPFAATMSVAIIFSAVSLVARYRRADADRRHQLKWIAVAAVLLGIAAPLGFGIGFGLAKAGQVAFILSLCGLPVAVGIAVLRYRLYEIDTLINRALVYGLLTAVIAGIYTASIGLMQRLSKAVTGGDSEATIVVTTIVIVVAFTPIKTRLQALVDRRFKETKDPRIQLEAFTTALASRMWPLDVPLVAQRLADAVVGAVGSAQAQLAVHGRRGAVNVSAEHGDSAVHSFEWSTSAGGGPTRLDLALRVNHPLSDRDQAAVSAALAAVAKEIDLAG